MGQPYFIPFVGELFIIERIKFLNVDGSTSFRIDIPKILLPAGVPSHQNHYLLSKLTVIPSFLCTSGKP